MNCAIVKEWMPHYIDGLLSPDMELSIRLHIESCPDCAQWLEEAKELATLWTDMELSGEYQHEQTEFEFPDFTANVMSHIEGLATGRKERAIKATNARRRTAPRSAWMHYGVAACLSLLLLQFGVFENLANGITEINGQMSHSVVQWFGGFGK